VATAVPPPQRCNIQSEWRFFTLQGQHYIPIEVKSGVVQYTRDAPIRHWPIIGWPLSFPFPTLPFPFLLSFAFPPLPFLPLSFPSSYSLSPSHLPSPPIPSSYLPLPLSFPSPSLPPVPPPKCDILDTWPVLPVLQHLWEEETLTAYVFQFFSISLLSSSVCAKDFIIKAFEYANDFDAVR